MFYYLPHRPEEGDVFLAIGLASLFYGVSMIHLPSAIILLGVAFIALSVLSDMQPKAAPDNGGAA